MGSIDSKILAIDKDAGFDADMSDNDGFEQNGFDDNSFGDGSFGSASEDGSFGGGGFNSAGDEGDEDDFGLGFGGRSISSDRPAAPAAEEGKSSGGRFKKRK